MSHVTWIWNGLAIETERLWAGFNLCRSPFSAPPPRNQPLDVIETGGAFLVRLDLPGVRSEQIRLVLDGERLAISWCRDLPAPGEEFRYLRKEAAAGPCVLELRFPLAPDPGSIAARLELGVLSVHVGKRARRTAGAAAVPIPLG